MDNNPNTIKNMHEEQGLEKIEKLQKRIDTTKYNIEVSEEIIAQTPSDAQKDTLTRKNTKRQHGIASIEKEIHDIEQDLEDL